ncbi:hypothetical protein QAD02_001214 [Eretmocerus hayati]|uniref:Uncharacterized protein n=1 Tax=Eretmocerus hayati TaxID=131215 RepID=A0ACC2NFI8_9HYME|nr:hypothetical protein QAD02_001214 [Eretmocerus hayati]
MNNDELKTPMTEEDFWIAKLLTPACSDPNCNWCKLQKAKKLAIRGALRYKPGGENSPVSDADEEALDLSVAETQENIGTPCDSTQSDTEVAVIGNREELEGTPNDIRSGDISSTPASPSPSESATPDSSSASEED